MNTEKLVKSFLYRNSLLEMTMLILLTTSGLVTAEEKPEITPDEQGVEQSEVVTDAVVSDDVPNKNISSYRLGSGDFINLTVYGEDELSVKKARVNDIGEVTIPLIGKVKVENHSIAEVESLIEEKFLDGYLKHPQISITIAEYRPVFISGEVKDPGSYPYVEGLTIRQAITIAGGFTDKASMRKIKLVKEGTAKEQNVAEQLDMFIEPGDVLTIGESLF